MLENIVSRLIEIEMIYDRAFIKGPETSTSKSRSSARRLFSCSTSSVASRLRRRSRPNTRREPVEDSRIGESITSRPTISDYH